jgi:hypothetical protein
MKVSERGGVAVYGLGRFPVTLYKEQWLKLLEMSDDIRAFISANEAQLNPAPGIRRTAEKTNNVLGVRELIIALGWHTRSERAKESLGRLYEGNELSDYWHLRFELLGRALGLPSGWSKDRAKTPRILEELVLEIKNEGFFSGFAEYTPLPGEMEIYEAHRTRIVTAERYVRERMLDYAEELLLTYWPQLRGKRVRPEELVSMGLPADQPDPYDFWP